MALFLRIPTSKDEDYASSSLRDERGALQEVHVGRSHGNDRMDSIQQQSPNESPLDRVFDFFLGFVASNVQRTLRHCVFRKHELSASVACMTAKRAPNILCYRWFRTFLPNKH